MVPKNMILVAVVAVCLLGPQLATARTQCSDHDSYNSCWPNCEGGKKCKWNVFRAECFKSDDSCSSAGMAALQGSVGSQADCRAGTYDCSCTVSSTCCPDGCGCECIFYGLFAKCQCWGKSKVNAETKLITSTIEAAFNEEL